MRCYRAGLLLLLLPCWVSADPARPTVSLPVGAGRLTAFRVTTPGSRRQVTIAGKGTFSETVGRGTARSRSGVEVEREGWVYLPGRAQQWENTVDGLGQIVPEPPFVQPTVVWCTAADRPDVRRALAIGLTDDGQAESVAVLTRYDDLPPHNLALQHLDSIVLDAPGLGRRPDLRAALRSYLLEGGRLVVCPAARDEVVSAPELAPYLPFDGQGKLRDGAWSADGMVVRAVGRGHLVLMAPGDNRDPERWRAARLNTGLEPRSLGGGPDPLDDRLLARMLDDGWSLPGAWLLCYLVCYLLCIMPWRRRQRYWWRAPLAAVSFLVAAPLLHRYAGRQQTAAFQGTVLRAPSGSRYGLGRTELAVSPGRDGLLWLEARPGQYLPEWQLGGSPLEIRPACIRHAGGRLLANPCRGVRGTAPCATADWVEDLGGAVTLDVVERDGRLSGTVRNGTRHRLRGAVLRGKQGCVPLGDLASGAAVAVPNLPPRRYEWQDDLVRAVVGAADQPLASRLRHLGHSRATSLSAPDTPAVLAWMDGEVDDRLVVVPRPRTTERLRLLAVALPRLGPKSTPPAWQRLARPGRQAWLAAHVGMFGWPSASLKLRTWEGDMHVWVPAEQRWEPVPLRKTTDLTSVPPLVATLRPASRYLRNGYLVVARPERTGRGPGGSHQSTEVMVTAEP